MWKTGRNTTSQPLPLMSTAVAASSANPSALPQPGRALNAIQTAVAATRQAVSGWSAMNITWPSSTSGVTA